ncbi:MAG TPA: hypothetical protein VGM11_07055 [Acidobacteriaceae bacterium]|jgi:hypothetical protein
MAAVWKRPSLTALEIAWRWAFGLLAAAAVWMFARATILMWTVKFRDIDAILLRGRLVGRGTADVQTNLWPLLGAVVAWSVFAGIGRGLVLSRWNRGLRARRGTHTMLALLRACAFAAVILLWIELLIRIADRCVWTPMNQGLEPSYVPGFALAVSAALILFVFWAAVSWVLRIAPVLSLQRRLGAFASLREAMRLGPLKSKLVEINLVMGIVKVALLVLAMVFSACPLPFESVESQTFLAYWWIGVGVLYLIASDFFHVVRAAAYETLYRVHQGELSDESR